MPPTYGAAGRAGSDHGGRPVAPLASPAGHDGEGEEVAVEILQRAAVFAPTVGRITEQLAGSRDLLEPAAPPRVGESEIEELQRPLEGGDPVLDGAAATHPPDFRPDVSQLLSE